MKCENNDVTFYANKNLAKKTLHITVPSKTFLLGEYVALNAGPVIVLTTEPRFELRAKFIPQGTKITKDIHPQSPAGQFIQRNAEFFKHYNLEFIDPYHGLGGFGASSAEFIMSVALKNNVSDKQNINDYELIDLYQKIAWDGEGIAPSGADLIAQLHGGICFFSKSEKIIKNFSWPFDDIEYCLVHTGNKIPTHQHLKQLNNVNTVELEKIVLDGKRSLDNKDVTMFINAINEYADVLQSQGLVLTQTQDIIKRLHLHPGILAQKGCGALGADVILVILEKKNRNQIVEWVKGKNLQVVTYGNQTAKGLNISEEPT